MAGCIGNEDDALGGNAARVFGGMNELAEGTLRLGDGHSHWDTDVDVGLVASRTFHVKHFSLPKLDVIGRENLLSEKLAKSLRLRIALEIADRDETTAKGLISSLYADRGNLISSNADNAKFVFAASISFGMVV